MNRISIVVDIVAYLIAVLNLAIYRTEHFQAGAAVLCSLQTKFTAVSSSESKRGVQCMSWSGLGVWLAAQGSFRVLLFHASTYDQLLEVNVGPAVAQKLQGTLSAEAFHSDFIGPSHVIIITL